LPIGVYLHNRIDGFGGMAILFSEKSNLLLRSGRGIYLLIDYINNYTPKDSLVLVFRQNDFALYGERKFIRHLDPRMIPVLQANDRETALRELHRLGVDYLLVPAYGVVTIFDTKIYEILSDPAVSEVVMESGGARLLKLLKRNEIRTVEYSPVDLGGGGLSVTRNGEVLSVLDVNEMHEIQVEPTGGMSYFYTGLGGVAHPPLADSWKIKPGAAYRFTSSISGVGWLRVYLVEYLVSGGKKISRIWESTMLGGARDVAALFTSDRKAVKYRIVYEMSTVSPAIVESIHLDEVGLLRQRLSQTQAEGMIWTTYDEHISYSSDAEGATTFKVDAGSKSQCIYSGFGSKAVAHSRYGIEPDRYNIWSIFPQAFAIDIDGHGVGEVRVDILFYSEESYISKLTLLNGFVSQHERFSLHKILVLPPGIKEYRLEFCFNNRVQGGFKIRKKISKMISQTMRWTDNINIEYSGYSELTIDHVAFRKLQDKEFPATDYRCFVDSGIYTSSRIDKAIMCLNPQR